jgi:uncharacterized protein (TIGR02996 family)
MIDERSEEIPLPAPAVKPSWRRVAVQPAQQGVQQTLSTTAVLASLRGDQPMTIEAGFLRAMVADPADDASRLVCADWLDEHGQAERAEFIRGQIHLANVTEDSLPRRKVARRMRELLEGNEHRWSLDIPYIHHAHYRRGFIDMVGIHAEDLWDHAAHLFAAVPLTRLWVSRLNGTLAALEQIPPSNTLRGLDLTCNELTFDALQELAAFKTLPCLRTLVLQCNALDDQCVPLLCEHAFFQRLSLVRCGANPISEEGRQRLAEHFGDRVSFVCERDEDHRYALEAHERNDPGFGNDDVQLMWVGWRKGVRVVVFDHEGNLLVVLDREVPGRPDSARWDHPWYRQREATEEAWKEELGFEPATIKFARFALDDGQRVNDFNWWQEAFDNWNHPQAEVRNSVERWLLDGQWEWDYGGDNFWVDGEGVVTDT